MNNYCLFSTKIHKHYANVAFGVRENMIISRYMFF